MGDFSSYYKYEKFEVIGDELIPLGIYSIDADGTMPYVVKKECDTACGCIEPQYRWIQTEDTICIEVLTQTVSGSPYCVGYDRYEDVYSQVSYDSGVTWETTATTSTMIEENSSACGYVPPTPTTEYRWVDDGGTTCVGVDKYNRKVKQVSYDGGSTWMNVSPLTVSATTLVEANSPDCGYVAPQYRTISGDPYCNGVDKYEDVYSQVSYDGGSSWETTATTSTLIQAKSADCGYAERTISGDPYCSGVDKYVDVSAQTSSDSGSTWTTTATTPTLVQTKSTDCGFSARTISTATTCVGVDKHYLDEYQESSDSGATWTTISSSTGTLIEAKSADCGYAERTISGTPYCDGADLVVVTSAQTSSDSGSTWTTVSTAITMVESGSSQCHQTVHVTGVTLNKNSMSLNSGSSETLVATVSPSNADDKSVTWSSNNTSVATVNSSGLVSAVTSGSATITVTTTDGGYTAQCSVSVSVPTPPTPTGGKFTLTLSDSSTVSAECDSTSAITKAEISAYTFTTVSAEIGDCVTTIGDNTFENCSGLTSVVISNGVTNIGQFAFNNCSGLTSVVIPDNVTSIMYGAFQRCTSITSCTIGDGIVTISSSLFRGCSSLSRITIPNNITSLGNSSFSGCTSLSTITIPNSVTSIGYTVFQNCSGLTSVTIGTGVTSIGNSAFANCSSLQSITCLAITPATLGGLYTFYNTNNCPIYVPCESVSAYQTAWDGLVDTSRIEGILVPSDYHGIYKGVLSNTQIAVIIRLSGSTLTSGNVSSHRDDTIKSFVGTGVTAIDDNTFSGFTMLTEVNIASTVTTIGNNAFKDCPQMNIIRVNATTPPALGSNAFDGTNDCPIQVPCGYASTYKSASGWSTYASRII